MILSLCVLQVEKIVPASFRSEGEEVYPTDQLARTDAKSDKVSDSGPPRNERSTKGDVAVSHGEGKLNGTLERRSGGPESWRNLLDGSDRTPNLFISFTSSHPVTFDWVSIYWPLRFSLLCCPLSRPEALPIASQEAEFERTFFRKPKSELCRRRTAS